MASAKKQIQQLARQFFKLSLVDGALSAERVTGVLEYVDKHNPPHAAAVLKAYHRLVATELARSQAVVEHAGFAAAPALDAIAAVLAKKYRRPITWVAKPNPALIAGLRVRVGDDVFESSIGGQLAALASSV